MGIKRKKLRIKEIKTKNFNFSCVLFVIEKLVLYKEIKSNKKVK